MSDRVRPRITVSIDPNMLDEVDGYVREHEGVNRSQVVDEALQCWYASVVREALARQHAAPKSATELAERAAWKGIRTVQAARKDRRD